MRDSHHHNGCRRSDHPGIDRRELLHAGALTLLGTGLGDLLKLEALAGTSAKSAPAKSVIFIFQSGGPSQHETFDPKPEAPEVVRGEYSSIATVNPELRVCEYLPKLAQRANLYSIVRTMYHPSDRQFRNEHSAAMYMVNTGYNSLPPGENTNSIAIQRSRPLEWPSIGSMISYAVPPSKGCGLPPVIEVPRTRISSGESITPGTAPGMLGPKYTRWRVHLAPPCHAPDAAGSCPNCFSHDQPDDPDRQPGKLPKSWYDNSSCRNPDFVLPDLGMGQGAVVERVENRAALLASLDQMRRNLDSYNSVQKYDAYQRQALELIVSQRGKRNPFDLTQETPEMRDQYGREEWGQALLVARRLVESGVRMVQVNLRGWDTHQNAFRDLKGKLLPSLDRCLSGFLDDMHVRGLLSETLIVMCGEMGRTPKISPIAVGGINAAGVPFTPGRHHWGDVFPCLFAGGGVTPGLAIGKTDREGGLPVTEGYTPADMAATIFSQMGIGHDEEFPDIDGRPFRIYQGSPIASVL
ncbi:DUF1501 domain-containing protein [Schlesneria sp.]|uniref:DUF1501 domain-containing protein n=1 Tax=Schlesneria sp. TaxID=2762018 RepID=UPI002F19DE49